MYVSYLVFDSDFGYLLLCVFVGRGGVGHFYFGIRGCESFLKTLFVEIYAGVAVMYYLLQTLVSTDGASTGIITL